MIRNYLISSWRALLRNRLEAVINIVGLAAGISAAILIYLYVSSENSYDTHHKDGDRIYRINSVLELDGQVDRVARNSLRSVVELHEDYPEIQDYCRVFDIGKQSIWYGSKMFSERNICFADSSYFTFFTYDFISGDEHCLDEPMQIAISEEVAVKYFGDAESAIGKQLKFTLKAYQVSAVFKSSEKETHIPYTFIISMSSLNRGFYQQAMGDYFRMMCFDYIKLAPGAEVAQLESKLDTFYNKRIGPWIEQNQVNGHLSYSLQPLSDIHLNNSWNYDYSGNGNAQYLQIFSIIGIFLLVVAAINYMNLSTARSSKRAREIGARMVAGASRPQLIFQFYAEAFINVLLALLLAIGLVEMLFPVFNGLTDKHFGYRELIQPEVLSGLAFLVVCMTLISGSYPAFYLSSVRPIEALKMQGNRNAHLSGWKKWFGPANLRRSLVVLQFSIAAGLIVSTLVVYGQLEYMRNKDLGFNQEGVVAITVPGDSSTQGRLKTLRDELMKQPGVKGVASTSSIPGGQFGKLYFVVTLNGQRTNKLLGFSFIDDEFIPLMNMKLEGRNFDRARTSDSLSSFIINEACARFLGWEDPIGNILENGFGMRGRIIGVVKDFHYASLHNPIEPMVFMHQPNNASNLLVRLESENVANSYDQVMNKWKELVPNHPQESYFLEDFIRKNYIKEGKMLQVFGYFTVLAVLISCLGLLGLASFSTEQRTKEIGIRKVLGASAGNIVMRLTGEFLLLVILASLLALPVTAWFLKRWLEGFAYALDMSFVPFVLSAMSAVVIAALTVSLLAWRAALSNPVKALRYE